ncbi:MAG: succinate--CoA ligase subunit alpha [Anaerolineaceae bacterium]
MGILINKDTRLLIQGITGHEGLFHTQQMLKFTIPIVAGVTPGKGGEWVLDGKVPVFDCVKTAVDVSGANTSVIFVPARAATDAIFEAADAGIKLIFVITEGIPIQDMMRIRWYLKQQQITLIGPNTPGMLVPNEIKIGIIPEDIAIPGNVGLVSRSGTLSYEIASILKSSGIGISVCLGIGGDPIVGTGFTDILDLMENDPHTEKVVLIGEIGGLEEQQAAKMISKGYTKPVVAFIAGQTAPAGTRMGHAGAIIERSSGSAQEKIEALEAAGAKIAHYPEDIPGLLM